MLNNDQQPILPWHEVDNIKLEAGGWSYRNQNFHLTLDLKDGSSANRVTLTIDERLFHKLLAQMLIASNNL